MSRLSRLFGFFAVFIVFLTSPEVVRAQQSGVTEVVVSQVDALSRAVDAAMANIETAGEDDSALQDINRRLSELSDQLVGEGARLSQRLSEIRTRMEQIAPPADGGTDPFVEERAALDAERASLNRLIGQLEQASVRARDGMDAVAQARRDAFANTLSRRYDLSAAFGGELTTTLSDKLELLTKRVTSWFTFTWRTKQQPLLGAVFLSCLIGLAGSLAGRRYAARLVTRDPAIEAPSYFEKLTTGFFYAVLPFFATIALLALAYLIFQNFAVLRPDISILLGALFGSIAVFVLVWRLAEALFSPRHRNWRIIEVADHAAFALKFLVICLALVTLIDLMITQVNDIIGHALPVTIAKSLTTSVLTGLLLIAIAFVRPFDAAFDNETDTGEPAPWPRPLRWALIGVGALLILSALAGYIGFARFVAYQVVFTGAILITALLGLQAAKAIAGERALIDRNVGTFLRSQFGLGEAGIDQVGLALGVLLGIGVLGLALPALAYVWGFDLLTIRNGFVWFFTGITIGSITISLSGLAAGVGLFAFGFWATRRIQNVIDRTVLERGRVEIGARTSIRTAIGYVGVAIAGLIGVSAAGIDLSQLAFIAGALSLGIGFGLQNIVNNFVSGLILLAERPFKSGDIIESGGYTGVVKNVNVRATELELFDRKTVILPNSELINSAVSNWMHRNTLARMEIKIGVGYGADPQLVIDTLLEIANDHPRILSVPEPSVAFNDFGASSLDFTLYGFIADVAFGLGTRTELRLEIHKRFKALGIEIPFPQRDVNLRITREHNEALAAAAGGKPDFDIISTSAKRTGEDDD